MIPFLPPVSLFVFMSCPFVPLTSSWKLESPLEKPPSWVFALRGPNSHLHPRAPAMSSPLHTLATGHRKRPASPTSPSRLPKDKAQKQLISSVSPPPAAHPQSPSFATDALLSVGLPPTPMQPRVTMSLFEEGDVMDLLFFQIICHLPPFLLSPHFLDH